MKIPETAIQQHVAVLGKTGSGKTFAVKGIVEHWLEEKRRVGIVDPTGAWWGLRSSRDGKGAGFPVLVLGGDHGDLPLPPLGGAAVARLLGEQNVNLIADTSLLTVGERTRWFTDFAGTLIRLNRAPLHLVLDEAHNFAPQGSGSVQDPQVGKMLHAANTLASGGRSRGIRLTMITQRPQKLHKDTLTSADTLIAMRVLAPQDRKAVEEWVKGCGNLEQGKEVLDSLASLPKGEGWVWHPEGGFLHRIKFPAIRTFDSSATPTDGAIIAAPKGMAELDLTEIRAAMADAVKEAEANDPKLLRAEIARLKREAEKKPAAERVEVPVRDEAAIEHAEQHGYARGRVEALNEAAKAVQALIHASPIPTARPQPRPAAAPTRPMPAPRAAPAQPTESMTGPQQRVLDALAWWASIGLEAPDKGQIGFLAGYRVGKNVGGTFGNLLGQLRSQGLIDYPGAGTAALTDAGRAVARAPSKAPTTEALQGAILARLDGPESRVLSALIEAYPRELTKQECGALSGYTVGDNVGGTFGNILGRLRSLGLIDYPSPGRVAALPVLFLD
jgi:uncharacterized protein